MSDKPRVVDGADRRRKRLLEMLKYIANKTESHGGATSNEIKRMMLMMFGLKHKTTSEYLEECHLGGIITQEDGMLWSTTKNYKKWAKYLYG